MNIDDLTPTERLRATESGQMLPAPPMTMLRDAILELDERLTLIADSLRANGIWDQT